MRPQIEELLMAMAVLLSQRSECTRSAIHSKNGAIIVSEDSRKIIGFGYNGREVKGKPCLGDEVGVGNCGCVHAEANALVNCQDSKMGATMYITSSPCEMCARYIINAGIRKIYYLQEYRDLVGLNLLKRSDVWTYRLSKKMSQKILMTSVMQLHDIAVGTGL